MQAEIGNNIVELSGTIKGGFTYSHDVFGEKFFLGKIETERTSGTVDTIPIMVSDRLIDMEEEWEGKRVKILGTFRSYNKHEENGSRLILSVFAREIEPEKPENWGNGENAIFLNGFICKQPIYRKTPLGREIADILLAVNRPYGKSDYIPCVAWGRSARFAERLKVGDRLKIIGRIQSREYEKKISETESEKRMAFEVSVQKLEKVEEDWNEQGEN